MAKPVVALLTDFGLRDHYVGAMKGVVLGICPEATLVDITHDIPPQSVQAAALELGACWRYFPPATVFLVVVDPGVGLARRAIAAEAGDYRFVAPDNGVLSLVFEEAAPRRVVELTERRYARATVSRTFEGRDRFAPAAAWLAKGIELSALGRRAGDVEHLQIPRVTVDAGGLRGEVLRVDRFGNLITNIDRKTFEGFAAGSTALEVSVGSQPVDRVVSAYGEVPAGELCALFGSTDHLEVAVSGGSAAQRLDLGCGTPVHISRRA